MGQIEENERVEMGRTVCKVWVPRAIEGEPDPLRYTGKSSQETNTKHRQILRTLQPCALKDWESIKRKGKRNVQNWGVFISVHQAQFKLSCEIIDFAPPNTLKSPANTLQIFVHKISFLSQPKKIFISISKLHILSFEIKIQVYKIYIALQILFANAQYYIVDFNIQWQIQDFPEEGAPTPRGAPTYDFAKFSQKLHEIEKIWAPREGGRVPRAPLRSATDIA